MKENMLIMRCCGKGNTSGRRSESHVSAIKENFPRLHASPRWIYLRYLRRFFLSVDTKPSKHNQICIFHQRLDLNLGQSQCARCACQRKFQLLSYHESPDSADWEADNKLHNKIKSAVANPNVTARNLSAQLFSEFQFKMKRLLGAQQLKIPQD